MEKRNDIRRYIWTVVNIFAILMLGLLLQTGGAYLVNAAVKLLSEGTSSGAAAASQYSDYMTSIRALEPRQTVHAIFVAPLVEELVFRLIFLRAGRMVLPFWAANLIQAVLFAVYHTVTIQKVYGFVMGLIIGGVFYYCPVIYKAVHKAEDTGDTDGSSGLMSLPNSLMGVAITFILHMIINATGIYVAPLFPADIPIAAQILIGCSAMIISAGAVVVLFLQTRRKSS